MHASTMMIHRSGSQAVKDYLHQINQLCDEQEQRIKCQERSLHPPIEVCTVLSRWCTDAYYAIVMSKNNGIATIIRAMNCWLDTSDSDVEGCHYDSPPSSPIRRRKHKVHSNASRFQECCVHILYHLSTHTKSIKEKIIKEGGKDVILAVARRHPQSIDIPSMSSLLNHEIAVSAADVEQEKQEPIKSSSSSSKSQCLESKVLGEVENYDEQHHIDTTTTTTLSAKVVAYF
jgi:hypothetical protein